MNDTLFILAGAAAAAGLVALSHRTTELWRYRIYGAAFVIGAGIYVAFAAMAGAFVVQELGGALLCAAVAVAGARGYPWALALGWALHVGWDMGLHGGISPVAPHWYPLLCMGFDLAIAGAIVDELVGRRAYSAGSASSP